MSTHKASGKKHLRNGKQGKSTKAAKAAKAAKAVKAAKAATHGKSGKSGSADSSAGKPKPKVNAQAKVTAKAEAKAKAKATAKATAKAKRHAKGKTKTRPKTAAKGGRKARQATALGTREVDVGAALRSVLDHHAPHAARRTQRAPRDRRVAAADASGGMTAASTRTVAENPVTLVQQARASAPFVPQLSLFDNHVATEGSDSARQRNLSIRGSAAATHVPARHSSAKGTTVAAAATAVGATAAAAPADSTGNPAAADRAREVDDPAARIPDIDIHTLHGLPSSLGEQDLHLLGEGNHRRLWEVLGSHPKEVAGLKGAVFAVWAPNARRVSVVGDFCHWDGNRFPMRHLGSSGVFELFIPGIRPGDLYKYEIVGADGVLRLKTDPMALKHEQFPGVSAIVQRSDNHAWADHGWMSKRASRDAAREPLAIYECHLASWARVPEEDHRSLSYREIAPKLAAHCRRLGFTHVELMPVMEHPFGGSWGYQVTGYYAPTSRHGTPDDFRFLVDTLHQAGLGVILDWVPAHFPKDEHAMVRFDGTALYEHEDPRLGTHPDWDTLIFNYGRNEVRNFLVANALFWLKEFHADGLRVDAVASMLYLDYSRRDGEWIPNAFGGRENIEAIEFVRSLNAIVAEECPGALMIAEESTSWSGITRPVSQDGGMGFTFKWNLGWMHDTLDYFAHDPIHRRWHQNELTFAMLYEHSERFIMPLSHDEVVHGKGSILSRLPGDEWQKLANLRALLAYQVTRPGKKLMFMGIELGQRREWDHDGSLDWHLVADPARQGLLHFLGDLLHLYREHSPFWRDDHDDSGFQWIDCSDHGNSVLAFLRWSEMRHMAVALNLTPVPRDDYRLGVPHAGGYRCVLSSDAALYGGSNYPTRTVVPSEEVPCHGFEHSIVLELPPLAALILQPEA